MIEAPGAFNAWGSSLIGGLVAGTLGAIFVILAVFYGQRLTDRRARADDRQRAAAELMVEVSNLRDNACSRRTGPTGSYAMAPLRNSLFTTYLALHEYPSHKVVDEFYKAVERWRQWARDRANDSTEIAVEVILPFAEDYQDALFSYGDAVIRILQDQLEQDPLDFEPPALPALSPIPA